MVDCEFGTCTGDAYDGDFVEGEIVNCAFHDVGGDAIDFSGSHGVVVRDTRLLRVADKGLSAGENSRIRGVGLLFRDVGIAVAAKDRSLVTIRDSAVHGGRYVLAAYQKKPECGPAAIVVESGLETTGDATLTIVQTGSRITIGKRVVEGSELDVDRMYEEGILGN